MSDFSRWDAGRGSLPIIRLIDRLPKTATNVRTKRRARQSYRLHHDRWYKPLIQKGRKP